MKQQEEPGLCQKLGILPDMWGLVALRSGASCTIMASSRVQLGIWYAVGSGQEGVCRVRWHCKKVVLVGIVAFEA